MSDIRTCWAFNKDGQRCEHPAGHSGNHIITAEWTDDECYSPIKHQLPAPAATPVVVPPVIPAAPLVEAPSKCVACGHSHKGGACGRCACYEHIG